MMVEPFANCFAIRFYHPLDAANSRIECSRLHLAIG